MIIQVLTLFPEMFEPVMGRSILGKAREKNLLTIETINIRDHTQDRHNRVDDTPFGGGAGMVLSADPVFRCLEEIKAKGKPIYYLSPRGRVLNQTLLEELSLKPELVLLCGHYEGVDQRIIDHWEMEEVSIGDYVLTGGELPAMVLIDGVARLLPEVLGSKESHRDESITSGLLEYPQYTRPREYRGMEVPEVLVSGNHREIKRWQFLQSLVLTSERRPELLASFLEQQEALTKEERKDLAEFLKTQV